ncbi:MAG: BsaA family SipW-dependent biofilm matrix protein [Clostridium sp.]
MKKVIVILIFTMAIAIVGSTYAYFLSKDEVINRIPIGDIDIEIDEEFTEPTNWKGEEVNKVVRIENKSKSDALIRVAIVPRWIDANGVPWAGNVNVAKLNFANNNISTDIKETGNNKWTDGGDGYYYYNTVIPKGSKTVEILNSVKVDIPKELKNRYIDKKLIIDVKAEAVQASKDGYRATWSNINEESKLAKMLDKLCE